MKFKTLENTTIDEILAVFNLSFANSIMPFRLTKDQFEHKIINDSIKLELSAGAFIANKLVGFILHGKDFINNQSLAYNAGTGVDPNFRGNKIISQLYDFILPVLKDKGITKMQLEAITENAIALSIYKRVGFKINRELDCYRGFINAISENHYEIRVLEKYDWQIMESFWDCQPSWQNAITAAENSFDNNTSIGIYGKEILLGYMIYNPISNKIQQLAIDKKHRRKGLARQLLGYASENNNQELLLNNIDTASKDTASLLLSLGLEIRIKQYEMSLEI
jgi:ribosomal protein S18 acetylase RimI-like enzyme